MNQIFFPNVLVSHMVIEEVSCIQNHLEIEKTCRESAEALATKVRSYRFFLEGRIQRFILGGQN